ncbi:MAG: TolB family protein [Candidatus Riflebacteria bacterium]|nr:TolB family protein [Candidatus Riflebacteria bacterium]
MIALLVGPGALGSPRDGQASGNESPSTTGSPPATGSPAHGHETDSRAGSGTSLPQSPPTTAGAVERHLANLRRLTHGGQNAEAYFSWDARQLVFQATCPPHDCDQIFVMDVEAAAPRLVSSGKGRTTCAFFFPDGKRVVYATTEFGSASCPPKPDRSKGYVWPIHDSYEIVSASSDGSDVKRLTNSPGYDAECALDPDGKRIVFTSIRSGDLDIYTMNADGTGVTRLTTEPGYDGGPFFSWDGTKIVYRSLKPRDEKELVEYRRLLGQGLIRPVHAELMVMDADGSNKRQLTSNQAANWAPFMHPNGRQIIFSSNLHDPARRSFSLYTVNVDGTGLERITYGARFDSFAMFSRDGKKLVFCSSRGGTGPHEFNVFVADWVP